MFFLSCVVRPLPWPFPPSPHATRWAGFLLFFNTDWVYLNVLVGLCHFKKEVLLGLFTF
jgi:hypothetical protein